jgi:hypothetical protein
MGIFCISFAYSQSEDLDSAIPQVIDSLYREDQFYVGFTYNIFSVDQDRYSENGFSGGLHAGFIRDMPFNKRRNWAVGLGFGISTNTVSSNLIIRQNEQGNTDFSYPIADGEPLDRNRFNTNLLEVPFQLRWRTSTADTYSFWRIYPGFRLGYVFYARSIVEQGNLSLREDEFSDLQRWRYAATLSVGNGSFNAFVYYSFNRLFDNESIDITPIKFGIEFYLL